MPDERGGISASNEQAETFKDNPEYENVKTTLLQQWYVGAGAVRRIIATLLLPIKEQKFMLEYLVYQHSKREHRLPLQYHPKKGTPV